MRTTGELLELLDRQEQLVGQLKAEAGRIDSLDYVSRNESLQQQLEKSKEQLAQLEQEMARVGAENRRLKDALVGHAYQEKRDHTQASWKRLCELSRSESDRYLLELQQIEEKYRQSINVIRMQMKGNEAQPLQALDKNLSECQNYLDSFLAYQRKELEARSRKELEESEREVSAYREKPLTEEEIKRQASRESMEFKVGGRIANTFGILLIVIGTVMGQQYTYNHPLISNPIKSATAYLLGILFLVGGELLGRKKRSLFSLGITAGGIAILFASTGVSLFVLEVLGLYAAFGMCVLVAALSLLLSLRYNSQTIANFSLIGGFLPVYAVMFGDRGILYTLMGYLVLLNFFTMYLSIKRNWGSVKYVSLFFNTATTLFIVNAGGGGAVLNLAYVTVNFAMYVFIALLHPMRSGKKIDTGSFVVVVLNSLINCMFVFGILAFGGLDRWMGLSALVLAVFYYGFSHYLTRNMAEPKLHSLFLATALVFAVLVVPLQFDSRWIAVSWLLEATVLILAGMFTKEAWYRRIGLATYVLSLVSFVLFDMWYIFTGFFMIKLSAIVFTSAFLFVAGMYAHRETEGYLYLPQGARLRWVKHYVMLLLYGYLVYTIAHILDSFMWADTYDFLSLALAVTAAYATLLLQLRRLRDGVTQMTAMILFAINAFAALCLNMAYHRYLVTAMPLVVIYVMINISGAYSLVQLTGTLARRGRIQGQVRPLIIFTYVLVTLLQMMMVQARVAFNDMILSFVLIVAALLYIIHGFKFRTPYTRRVGLGLSIATVVKFFIVDLSFLQTGQKIISYFVLGLMLIGISFVYQNFAKRVFALDDVAIDPTEPPPPGEPTQQQAPEPQAPDDTGEAGQEEGDGHDDA